MEKTKAIVTFSLGFTLGTLGAVEGIDMIQEAKGQVQIIEDSIELPMKPDAVEAFTKSVNTDGRKLESCTKMITNVDPGTPQGYVSEITCKFTKKIEVTNVEIERKEVGP